MKIILAIFIGGGLGSVARYLTGKWMLSIYTTVFPLGTLIANLLSCFLLGIFIWLMQKGMIQGWGIPFLTIGFCGGYSTFSTFSLETLTLMTEGKWNWVILNIGVSLAGCIFVLFALSKMLK